MAISDSTYITGTNANETGKCDTDDDNNIINDDVYLSNHTIATRKALQYCLQVSQSLKTTLHNHDTHKMKVKDHPPPSLQEGEDAEEGTRKKQQGQQVLLETGTATKTTALKTMTISNSNLAARRRQALERFHQRTGTDGFSRSSDSDGIEILPDLDSISPREFRRRFQQANIPCKIRGNTLRHKYFAEAHTKFESVVAIQEEESKKEPVAVINRDWFRSCLGPDTLVPVRLLNNPTTSSLVSVPDDEAGRAVECETRSMKVREWIDLLQEMEEKDSSSMSTTNRPTNSSKSTKPDTHDDDPPASRNSFYYLKDWHLQAWLQSHAPQHLPLYRVPEHFGVDLLNRFLTRFFVVGKRVDAIAGSTSGSSSSSADYFFCYWGPRGSRTLRHSDVLSSFSWSYNVCGTKQWTFYPPTPTPTPTPTTCPHNSDSNKNRTCGAHRNVNSIRVIQEVGEAMFVPSNWPHEVINLVETLSLNHNWITTANLDLVWDQCLVPEMVSIERELASWEKQDDSRNNPTNSNDYWDSRESMLRGCVGLDVTAFFLMMAVGIVDTIQEGVATITAQQQKHQHPVKNGGDDDRGGSPCSNTNSNVDSGNDDFDDYGDRVFDLTRLRDMLRLLVETKDLALQQRLQATLADQTLGQEAYKLATTTLVELIEDFLAIIE